MKKINTIPFTSFPEAFVWHDISIIERECIVSIGRKNGLIIRKEGIEANLLIDHAAHLHSSGINVHRFLQATVLASSEVQNRAHVKIKFRDINISQI